MTLEAIKREIGKKLGDPDLQKYRGVVQDAFTDSIISLLNLEQYTQEEVFSLVKRIACVTVEDGQEIPFTTDASDVDTTTDSIKILSVVGAAGTGNQFLRKTPEEIDRIKTDSELDTWTSEVFWYLVANKIFFHPAEVAEPEDLLVQYIAEPDFSGWANATDIESEFRLTFIKRAIGLAVSLLGGVPSEELQGEQAVAA